MDKIPTQYIYNSNDSNKTAHSVGFHRVLRSSQDGNIRISDRRLVVNCAGRVDLPYVFTTHEPVGRHDFYLMYMISGELDTLVAGRECRVVPGMAVIFPPEVEYRYTKVSESDIQYLYAHFTGFDAQDMLDRLGFGEYGAFAVGIDNSITLQFMQLLDEFVLRDSYSEECAALKLNAIFVALRRRIEANEQQSSSSLGRIFKSLRHIHENYRLQLTNEQLAGIEHLSVSQYIELFKRCTGKTPRSYLIELRIASACDLLSRSDLSVAEIAQSVGYDDAHYFSRLFKVHRGISPERYRGRDDAAARRNPQ